MWSDVVRGALSFFLVIVGIGLGYLFWRLGGTFGRLSTSITRITDETVPILSKSQTTVDRINLELVRVDDIMQSAVTATKGAERTVGTVTRTVSAPVRKAAGVAAGVKEAATTLRSRREAAKLNRQVVIEEPVPAPPPPAAPAGGPDEEVTAETPAA
jgi:hypothetical protein